MTKVVRSHGIRWDIVVGLITIVTIVCFGIIIVADINSTGKKSNDGGETMSMEKHTGDAGETYGDTEGTKAEYESVAGSTVALVNTPVLTVKNSPVVCIDAAHGGTDKGTEVGGVSEKDQNLKIALSVKKYLEQSKVKVVMTRTSDETVDDKKRTDMSNSSNAVVTVSINRNSAAEGSQASGIEAWIHHNKPAGSSELSDMILKEVNSVTGMTNRGVKAGTGASDKQDYYVNTHCSSSSCVLQVGFMTNVNDNKYVTTELENTAKAISDGIVKYLKTKGY